MPPAINECNECGCEITDADSINHKNELYGTEIVLTLCPDCKLTLAQELIESECPEDLVFIRNLLSKEITKLHTELKRLGKIWKEHLGKPLTKERLTEHNDKPLTVSYLTTIRAIEECEGVLDTFSKH